MKRLPFILILILAAACASSKDGKKKPDPPIEIDQLVGPAQLSYPYGPIEVQYQVVVQNPSAEPITLIRIDVSTLNPAGGAYALRRDFYNVRKTIAPNATDGVTFWAKAFAYGRGPRDTEPITIRAIAYFESPSGNFQKVFIRELSQYPE